MAHIVEVEARGLKISVQIPQDVWDELEGTIQVNSGQPYSREAYDEVLRHAASKLASYLVAGLVVNNTAELNLHVLDMKIGEAASLLGNLVERLIREGNQRQDRIDHSRN